MRKLHVLGLAAGVVCAVCAFSVSSASAAPEWLIDSNTFTAETPVQGSGLLILIDTAAGTALDCKGIIDGEITAANDVMILALLMENGELLKPDGTAGTATDGELDMIDCVLEKAGGCKAGTEVLVTALNLPWLLELELMEPKAGEDLILEKLTSTIVGKAPAFESECTNILGGKSKDTCEGNTSFDLQNMTTETPKDVLGTITQKELEEGSESLLCTFKNEKTGFLENTEGALIFSEAGLDLEISG